MSTYPSNLVLLAGNRLEAGTVTTTSAATGKPATRLYDRDRGPQWEATTTGAQNIDADLGTSQTATALALVNHSLTGVTLSLLAADTTPPGTVLGSPVVDADPFFYLIPGAATPRRYWRVSIPAVAAVTQIGELMIGTARVISLAPALASSGVASIANVTRDRSPAGVAWAAKLGEARDRLPYAWEGLGGADLAILQTAWAECDEGAKNLIVRDPLGVARFMSWVSPSLAPVPLAGPLAADLYRVPEAVFEEAL